MNKTKFSTEAISGAMLLVVSNLLFTCPAYADDSSSEMKNLVRESSGLSPDTSVKGPSNKDKMAPNGQPDPTAIYVQAGASQEQRAQITKLRNEFNTYEKEKLAEIMRLIKEMREETMHPTINEEKVISIQEKLNTLQSELSTNKTKEMINIRKVLTPKQRETLIELVRKHHEEAARSSQKPPEILH